jgi:hypothetical protein
MRWCTAFRRRENESRIIFVERYLCLAAKAWTPARSTISPGMRWCTAFRRRENGGEKSTVIAEFSFQGARVRLAALSQGSFFRTHCPLDRRCRARLGQL